MKGSEKQIKWTESIIEDAKAACDQIIIDAEQFEKMQDATICRPVKVAVAKQLKEMVVSGLEAMVNASDIINNRGRFTYDTLLGMAIQFSK